MADQRMWQQVHALGTPPPKRGRHTGHVLRGPNGEPLLLIFGGQNFDLQQKYNTIALFNLDEERWVSSTEYPSPPGPVPRSSHSSVFVEEEQALYVFCGTTGVSEERTATTSSIFRYLIRSDAWEELFFRGYPLAGRFGHVSVLSSTAPLTVFLHGGKIGHTTDHCLYRIDLGRREISRIVPAPIASFVDVERDRDRGLARALERPVAAAAGSAVADALPAAMLAVALGGDGGGSGSGGGACCTTNRFCPNASLAYFPGGIFGHTAVYNPVERKIFLFGGTHDGAQNYMQSFAWFDVERLEWGCEHGDTPPPRGRYVHSAAIDPTANKMYIFGGFDGSYRNDLHEYDFDRREWREFECPGVPLPRSGCSSWVYNDHLYIFGGCDDTQYFNDIWKLKLNNEPRSLVTILLRYIAEHGLLLADGQLPPSLAARLSHEQGRRQQVIWRGVPTVAPLMERWHIM